MNVTPDPIDYDDLGSLSCYQRAALANGHYEHNGEWFVYDKSGDDCRVFASSQQLCEALGIDPATAPDVVDGYEPKSEAPRP